KRFKNLTDEERRDLSQSVFLILLDGALRDLRNCNEHGFRAYLWSITDNAAKRYLRRRNRSLEISNSRLPVEDNESGESSQGTEEVADPGPGPEILVAEREIREQLRGCLAQIPLCEQEVFWLRERGASYEEISQLLEIPQPTAGTRYHRAKERI